MSRVELIYSAQFKINEIFLSVSRTPLANLQARAKIIGMVLGIVLEFKYK